MKKILLLLFALVTCINAWGETYTITFATNTSDGSTEITTSTKVSDVVSDGAAYVSGFTSSCSKAYMQCTNGVKLGTSKAAGTFEFTLASVCQSNVKSITVKSVKYSSDTGTLTLSDNSGSLKTGITPGTDYTYTYTSVKNISSIKVNTSSKRAFVSEIVIETDDSAPTRTTGDISATYKTAMFTNETDVYDVTYNGNGALSVTSSNTSVATVAIAGNTVTVTPHAQGTTEITISAPQTSEYTAAEKKYTLTVTEAFIPATLPFSFNGKLADITISKGMIQKGLAADYKSAPYLKFDGSNDYLVIQFNGVAAELSYKIIGYSYDGSTYTVQESADGETYTNVHVFTELEEAVSTVTDPLKPSTRYVKFVYTNKSAGNVGLGSINITNEYSRTVTEGNYGTICLPCAVEAGNILGATFYNVVSIDGTGIAIEEETGDLVAGKPYIFKATDNMILTNYTGDAASEPVANNGLVGNFSEASVDVPADCYVLSGNKLRKVEVAGAAVVGMNRAYINPSQISSASSQSGIRINFEESEGNETGVDAMKVNENVEVYDIMGRKVTNPTKGIYVINGKKVVIK